MIGGRRRIGWMSCWLRNGRWRRSNRGSRLPILSFSGLDEAIAKANNTNFGLAAYVLTNDLTAAMKCADGLEFGTIGINDTVPATPQGPFGGLKESGIGRENAIEGMDVYLETKFISMALRE